MDPADFTVGERTLWDAFADGRHVDLGGPDPTLPDADAAQWPQAACLRAEVIAALLLGAVAPTPGRVARVHLDGARIVGDLNLMDGRVEFSLGLGRCWLDAELDLGDARTVGVWLHGCRIPTIGAGGATIDGPLVIENCVVGRVGLEAAQVRTTVRLAGSALRGGSQDGMAVSAVNASIGLDFVLPDRPADGTINLAGATIGGSLRIPNGATASICLDGTRYVSLRPDAGVATWLHRLHSDPHGYHPQPYEHLAEHYRQLGHDKDASKVRLAQLRERRRRATFWRRLGSAVLDMLAGYGYAPGRALATVSLVALAGAAYFYSNPPTSTGPTVHFGLSSALLYTVDALVPTSPLGQLDQWQPATAAALNVLTILHVIGWVLSLAIVPAVARALSQQR